MCAVICTFTSLNKELINRMLSINYNSSVLTAKNNLTRANSSLSVALERMSTGFKINTAKDDAAGLFVATGINSQIRGLNQARSNAENGLAVLSIAENSLGGMKDIVNRIRDLSVQGANGVYDYTARKAMQDEADLLVAELGRLRESTLFNGRKLFADGSAPPPRKSVCRS